MASDYIFCTRRSGHPKIHHRICEEGCSISKKCVSFKSWCVEKRKDEAKDGSKKTPDIKKTELLINSLILGNQLPIEKKKRGRKPKEQLVDSKNSAVTVL